MAVLHFIIAGSLVAACILTAGCKPAEIAIADIPAIQTLRDVGSSIAIAPGNNLVQVSFKQTLPTSHHPDAIVLHPATDCDLASGHNWDDVAESLRDLADCVSHIRIELGSLPEAERLVNALPDTLSATISKRGTSWHLVDVLASPTRGE